MLRWGKSPCIVVCYLLVLYFQFGDVTSQLDSGIHRMDFPEEQEPGTVVAKLAQLFNVRSNDLPGRRFQILGQRMKAGNVIIAQDGKWLKIDENTGIITVNEPVDRESECGDDSELECVIMLQVAMMPQTHFRLQDFELVVTDVNDHAPKFPSPGADRIFSVNVSEAVPEGSKINLDYFLASDEDIDENALIYYSVSRNEHFDVAQFKDDTGATHLELIVLSELDYEETHTFDLTLTAKDRGSPAPLSSQVFLRINVLDANDNPPIFDEAEYNLELRENLPIGKIIATVVARDADTGSRGRVRYFVPKAGNSVTARKLVTVDPLSGEVKLSRRLDREIKQSIRVVIAARDMAGDLNAGSKIGKTMLVIHIIDDNDNSPQIHVNVILKGPNKDTIYIPEDVALGTYVAYVSATDADNGDNGRISLSITTDLNKESDAATRNSKRTTSVSQGTSSHDYFVLKNGNLIATNSILDREQNDKYVIVIKACDHGNPKKCSSLHVPIVILDANDHKPRFRNTQNFISLSEDTRIGSYITSISAYDGDAVNTPAISKNKNGEVYESQNGEIRYSMIGGGSVFAIESNTGKLTLVGRLDYEKKKQWKLTIVAQDLGEQTRKSNFTLTINVADVNDHKPQFIHPGVNNMTVFATILEGDRNIIRVKTVDRDSANNAEVWYTISSEDGARKSKKFLIDPVTGSLRLNASNKLTELLGEHALQIKASDKGNPPLESDIWIIIKVTDLPLSSIIPNYREEEEAESSRITVIVLASLASATVVLLVILACIVIKCRKENKEIRTYNCQAAESKSGRSLQYPSRSSFSHMGSIDEVVVVATPGIVGTESVRRPMVMNRSKSMTLRKDAPTLSAKYATIDKGITFSTFTHTDDSRSGNQARSAHTDRDSGRGDSDKESDSNGGDKDGNGSLAQSDINSACTGYANNLGSRCTISCKEYGHSDDCWMPIVAHCDIHGEHNSFIYSDVGDNLNHSLPNCDYSDGLLPSTNSLPGRYNNFDNCGLETISETQPLRIVLDTNDQTSIYSSESFSYQDYPTYPVPNSYPKPQQHGEALQTLYSPPSYYSALSPANRQTTPYDDQTDWRDAFRSHQATETPNYAVRSSSPSHNLMSPQMYVPNSPHKSRSDVPQPHPSFEMLQRHRVVPPRPRSVCEAPTSTSEVLSIGNVQDKIKRFSQVSGRRDSLRDRTLQSQFLSSGIAENPTNVRVDHSLLLNHNNHNNSRREDSFKLKKNEDVEVEKSL